MGKIDSKELRNWAKTIQSILNKNVQVLQSKNLPDGFKGLNERLIERYLAIAKQKGLKATRGRSGKYRVTVPVR